MDVSRQLALVAALVLINAAFAGSEVALISLREGQLRRLEQRGDTGAGSLLAWHGNPTDFSPPSVRAVERQEDGSSGLSLSAA